VYVTDSGNQTIRAITPAGAVSTVAGKAGEAGSADGSGMAARFSAPAGIAVDASGNAYVADFANGTIRRITPSGVVSTLAGSAGTAGSADGTGSAASFLFPSCVALDGSGSLYVADFGNDTIRKLTPGGRVSTLVGTAGTALASTGPLPATLYRPACVAVAAKTGALLITVPNAVLEATF
jgi:DNA-binding beta-propeller fold protein YncE